MMAITKKHSFNTVYDCQTVYRKLLKAISNPTVMVNIKEQSLKLFGDNPELLALAFTLLDNEVGYTVSGSDELSEEISYLTNAKNMPVETADYIFITDPSLLEAALTAAKCGTLTDPHKSATIIIKNRGSEPSRIFLSGPGIKDSIDFYTTETVKKTLEFRDSRIFEYPQGIDLIFIYETGDMFALPRLISRGDI